MKYFIFTLVILFLFLLIYTDLSGCMLSQDVNTCVIVKLMNGGNND